MTKNPIFWGVVGTVLLLAGTAILALGETCSEGSAGEKVCVPRYAAFLAASPNEMGDTFAGLAGALAFLWIIVTVMMQSQELAAQREELRLTRKESARMAKALDEQADVFRDEQRQRHEQANLSLLKEHLRDLRNLLGELPVHGARWTWDWPREGRKTIALLDQAEIDRHEREDDELASGALCQLIVLNFGAVRASYDSEEGWAEASRVHGYNLAQAVEVPYSDCRPLFERIRGVLAEILLLIDGGLSPAMSARYARFAFREADASFREVLETDRYWRANDAYETSDRFWKQLDRD